MLKVSFKKDSKKVQTFYNKATIVTLTGEVRIPRKVWDAFPRDIIIWVRKHPKIDFDTDKSDLNYCPLILEFTGKSICAEGDTFDEVTGYRIAESRAKIKIYKFMHTFCEMLMRYYYNIMYGNTELIIKESHTEAPKDCLSLTCKKYTELWLKESHHLGKLLEEV